MSQTTELRALHGKICASFITQNNKKGFKLVMIIMVFKQNLQFFFQTIFLVDLSCRQDSDYILHVLALAGHYLVTFIVSFHFFKL